MLWFGRIKRRFPVSELAGVAPEAQNTCCRECFQLANQAAVLRRKEIRVRKLLHLIRQADKVNGHMRASRFAWNGEGNPDLALALRVKTCCNHGAGCGGKKFSACEHRIPRFIVAEPRALSLFVRYEYDKLVSFQLKS